MEASFDGVTVTSVTTGSILTDSVGKVIVGGLFVAAGHIKMAPVNVVAGRIEGLSPTS